LRNFIDQYLFNRLVIIFFSPLLCLPTAGSCSPDFAYSVGDQTCLSCSEYSSSLVLVIVGSFVLICGLSLVVLTRTEYAGAYVIIAFEKIFTVWQSTRGYFPFNLLRQVNTGQLKIGWSLTQILSTISFNLLIKLPDPFEDVVSSRLSYVRMDFLPLHCYFPRTNFLTRVLAMSR